MTMGIAAGVAMRQQQEEENFTPSGEDWRQYEFKMLRTSQLSTRFSATLQLREVLAEEAVAGWELHEKLDNCRLRLRRPVSYRAKDALLTQDPYRSFIRDPQENRRWWLLFGKTLGTVFLVMGVVVGIFGTVLMVMFSHLHGP